jgi:hypothetical protein
LNDDGVERRPSAPPMVMRPAIPSRRASRLSRRSRQQPGDRKPRT